MHRELVLLGPVPKFLSHTHRYDHVLAYLRSPPNTIDHVASLPLALQPHAGNPARLEALLTLRDEAAYLDLPELVQLCVAELRRNFNGHPSQHSRTLSHHTRGPSNGSMRSMDTLREYNEQDASPDADTGSSSTSRDSIGSARSLGSIHGRGRGHTTTKEKEEQPHPTPVVLLHRRLASQSRERPELAEVKSASLRGRSTGNWI